MDHPCLPTIALLGNASNEMDRPSMLGYSRFTFQFSWLKMFLTFKKHPLVPYHINQLCNTFVEGLNTTLHPGGLEGC